MRPPLHIYDYTNEVIENVKGVVWLTENKRAQRDGDRKPLSQHISSSVQALERHLFSRGDTASVNSTDDVSHRVIHRLLRYPCTGGGKQ